MKVLTLTQTYLNDLKQRIIKAYNGKSDSRSAKQVASFGIDSNPVNGTPVIYAMTELNGKEYILGCVNKDQLAEVGETRIYATDTGGNLKTFVWMHADGTIDIGGDQDNAVRYIPLNSGIQQMATDINTELTKIATAITALGGAYATVPIVPDISGSKINEIKTL